MNGNTFLRLRAPKFWQFFVAVFTSLILVACGGGSGGSSDSSAEESGEIIIGLTDAEGDFHNYIVDVLSVKLEKQNGAVVETLPLSTRVDFAQYTELTEFLTAATVPTGIYTAASITVDFSNAELIVEDAMGAGVEANPVDANGDPMGQVEMRVDFENTDTLRIARGIPAHITLDFDLAASNTVDLTSSPAVVTVEPILLADTILEDPKPRRLRGLLNEVAVDDDIFSLYIRPFFHHNGDFGSVRVHSTDDTEYDVDGQLYMGHAGIEAMAELDPREPVIVFGELDRTTRQFKAQDVVAGSSVPWADDDFLSGNVIARDGDELTLARVIRSHSANSFRQVAYFTVTIGDNTGINQQGNGGVEVDKQAISIGQRIRVMGEFTDDTSMDATQGRVWMRYTHVDGTALASSPLVVDLQHIGSLRPTIFDFTGTGSTEDADPSNYEVDSGSLTLSGVALGEAVRIKGHVTPFGSAPEDFTAKTVIALNDLPAKFLVNWDGAGTTAPFVSQSDEALVINLDPMTIGNLHQVIRAGVATDLLDLNLNPTLAATDSGRGIYTIYYQGRIRQYLRFERFSESLGNLLDGSNVLSGIRAHGVFDDSSATLTARKIIVRVN